VLLASGRTKAQRQCAGGYSTIATEACPDTGHYCSTLTLVAVEGRINIIPVQRTGTQGVEGRRKSADLKLKRSPAVQ
jgi:hypothetical protein